MAPRLELQSKLETLLGSRNVYFQPPPGKDMVFPCIVYKRDDIPMEYADNSPYKHMIKYQVTVVDQNPDGEILEKVLELPLCSYDRFYTADQLNHDVFSLFF